MDGISICLTAWNTQDYVEECLDSVANQTWFKNHDNWEILLGIDACEKTLEKVKQIQHRYQHLTVYKMTENVGTYVTSNTIMSLAQYDWLLRFDTDDIMYPNMVEVLMAKKGNADYIQCRNHPFTASMRYSRSDGGEGQPLIRKETFQKFGGFMNWKVSADSEFRVRTKGKIKQLYLTDILFDRRIHDKSLTQAKETGYRSALRRPCNQYIATKSSSHPIIKYVTAPCKRLKFVIKEEQQPEKNNNIVVSFTSYPARFSCVPKVVQSIWNNTVKPSKVILTLAEKDSKKISSEIKDLVQKNLLEILIATEDLRPHNKYFYTMQKYRDSVIITVDDDIVYDKRLIETLYRSYKRFPNQISAVRVNKVDRNKPYSQWIKDYKGLINIPTFDMLPTGVGGVLYPPNILNVNENWLPTIKEFITVDDMVLYHFELEKGIKTVCCYSGFVFGTTVSSTSQEVALYKINNPNNDKAVKSILIKPVDILNSEIQKKFFNLVQRPKFDLSKLEERRFLCEKNESKVNDNTVLVSMTTYPLRINSIYGVLLTLLNQNISTDLYKCILVLSEQEFMPEKLPTKLKKLEENGWLEIIWTPDNVRSHKKYIPTAQKYPNNDIIIVDDDLYRSPDFLETLIKDAKNHPGGIITCLSSYYFDKNQRLVRIPGLLDKWNVIPNIGLVFSKFGTGSGTYIPDHTFTDPRFFDKKLYMSLSSTSDESWMNCFAIIEDRDVFQSSKIWDLTSLFVPNSQEISTALYKTNNKKYPEIHQKLCQAFPEFKQKLQNRLQKYL